jgi:hypothetical protein
MFIPVNSLNFSTSVSMNRARFKRRRLSAVVPLCLISAKFLMSVAAWVDTPARFGAAVIQ